MTEFIRYGTDSSDRPIYMTPHQARWWEGVVRLLGFRPTIVQGAFMSKVPGGGADNSKGYHDLAGTLDIRVSDLTPAQIVRLVHVTRDGGAAGWVRDAAHGGMDPHYHLVLIDDAPLSAGAASQVAAYEAGRDGLASNGPDYHYRPSPLVLSTPRAYVTPPKNNVQKARAKIRAALELLKAVPESRKVVRAQRRVIRDAVRKMPKA